MLVGSLAYSVGQGTNIATSCSIGHRLGSGIAVAVAKASAAALIQPLPWELPYAKGATLKRQKIIIN